MHYLIFPRTLWIVLLTLCFMSCKKGWLDVNYNPQQVTDKNADVSVILPTVLMHAPTGNGDVTHMLQFWMGYWAPPSNFLPGRWELSYDMQNTSLLPSGAVSNVFLIENMEQKARETKQEFYAGIAKVIKAIHWTREVDFLNNVPYREFNKFDIVKPKYDEGQFIYEEEMKHLDSAIILITRADMGKNLKLATSDIMFHGNKTKWLQFINTLKLRLLVHQANRADRASYIQAEIAKIMAQGSGFLSTGENASVNPGFTDAKPNPFYRKFGKMSLMLSLELQADNSIIFFWERLSANFFSLELLKSLQDPRLELIYQPAAILPPPGAPEPFPQSAPANYRGNKLGQVINPALHPFQTSGFLSIVRQPATYAPVTSSSIGPIKGYNMDVYLMTSIESMFLQAEAIQRGWITGNAEQAYLDAVKESFRWLNAGGNSQMPALSDDVFNSYYSAQVAVNNDSVSWQAAPDKYKLLMLQKYIALNSIDAVETYTDYRRNGRFPNIPVSLDPGVQGNAIPIRIVYSKSEYLTNTENVNAQGTINVFTSKIWWMP